MAKRSPTWPPRAYPTEAERIEAEVAALRNRAEYGRKTMPAWHASLEDQVAAADETLAKFAKDMQEDAAHAFEWGWHAFKAAASKKVAQTVLARYLADDVVAKHGPAKVAAAVVREATDSALRYAHHGAHSTSICSNLMEECVASAWADMIEQARARVAQIEGGAAAEAELRARENG